MERILPSKDLKDIQAREQEHRSSYIPRHARRDIGRIESFLSRQEGVKKWPEIYAKKIGKYATSSLRKKFTQKTVQ